MIRALKDRVIRRAARSYVAGPELEDALRICRVLDNEGMAITACYWDDGAEPPSGVADQYRRLLAAADGEPFSDFYLSVKAPALARDAGLVRDLADESAARGRRLHFDSLSPETADATFAAVEQALERGGAVGCTLPASWRRSAADCNRALALDVSVRVVKGQWPEPGQRDSDTRRAFLHLIDLLAGAARSVAVATHDRRLAVEALARLRAAGTPCELELLYGLPSRALVAEARASDLPVRAYVPYGHAWLPYAARRAERNPRLLLHLLHDAVRVRKGRWPS